MLSKISTTSFSLILTTILFLVGWSELSYTHTHTHTHTHIYIYIYAPFKVIIYKPSPYGCQTKKCLCTYGSNLIVSIHNPLKNDNNIVKVKALSSSN